jgi:hypothetical protein
MIPSRDRSKLRYPSNLTDEEWAPIGPLIPPAKKGGNNRTVDVRAVVNGAVRAAGKVQTALPNYDVAQV